MTAPHRYAQSFAELFALEPCGEDVYSLHVPFSWGGASLAAGTLAACLTAPDRTLRSLHAWFLHPVPSDTEIVVRVDRLRDGRLLSHRRVVFEAEGRALFELTASLGAAGAAPDAIAWQEGGLAHEPPAPEAVVSLLDRRAAGQDWREVLDWRPLGQAPLYREGAPDSAWGSWVRPTMSLPEGKGWAAAALAYMSDNHSDWSMAQRVKDYTIKRYSTLDTQIWFHRPPEWDDWLFVQSVGEVAYGGYGLGRRSVFDRRGALVATMLQEALYR